MQSKARFTFPQFVDIVVDGYTQLAEFMDKNRAQGQSLGLDTSLVDGKGTSKKWAPYWMLCSLCHPDFRPKYILNIDHFKDDIKVNNQKCMQVFSLAQDVREMDRLSS